jgi:hypothetical protein
LSEAGYFDSPLAAGAEDNLQRMAYATNNAYTVEHRARSYLAANCAQCHQPGGSGPGSWDARLFMPLSRAGMVNGQVGDDLGNPASRVIKPASPGDSMILTRISTPGSIHMPPLATGELDSGAISLLEDWIMNTAFVVGRHVFYNNSKFDGNDASAGPADDAAIAPDKSALLPGQTSKFANYTSYYRGINGVMVDIVHLAGMTGFNDFVFKAGNDNNPDGWTIAPAPASITVRARAGVDGSDRVTLIWADNAIQKQWLQVTVRSTATTGLGADDVFYFGNSIGDTGNSAIDAKVNATDEIIARNNPRALNQAPINSPYDFNRDSKVNATDEIIARNNATSSLTALHLASVPLTTTSVSVASGNPSSESLFAASPLRIVSLSRAPEGTISVRFFGPTDRSYSLQASDGLVRPVWSDVSSSALAVPGLDGALEFTIRESSSRTARFFRIKAE